MTFDPETSAGGGLFEVEITPEGAFEAFLQIGYEATDAVQRRTLETLERHLRELTPEDSGEARRSWRIDEDRGRVVNLQDYIRWVVEGTGIYGPTGQRITPRVAKALRFEIDGVVIYAASVSGSPPNPFHERAMELTEYETDRLLDETIRELERMVA